MTHEDLARLRQLHAIIARLHRQTDAIMASATSVTPGGDGLPPKGAVSDKVGRGAVRLAEVEEAYKSAFQELDTLKLEARQAIDGIQNSDVHGVMYMRYVGGKHPEAIAYAIHVDVRTVYRWLNTGERLICQ